MPITESASPTPRSLFSEDHDQFRATVRRFVQEELLPHHRAWEIDGVVPRAIWRRAGEIGLLCPDLPAQYGGAEADWLCNVIAIEELARAGITGPGFMIHSEMVAPYILVCAAKTAPEAGAKGVSLIAIEADQPGFRRGRNLEKIGLKAQDTSEIFLEDAVAPVSNLLGDEGQGFAIVMAKLVRERLAQAVRSVSVCEAAIEWTVSYTADRKAFGHTIADFQNTQFVLAELSAETSAARVFTDWCIVRFLEGALTPVEAAKVKLLTTNLHCKVVDECLQFFGGYGYMAEFPIARAYVDARIARIAGGAAEVMKQIIGRDLFTAKRG